LQTVLDYASPRRSSRPRIWEGVLASLVSVLFGGLGLIGLLNTFWFGVSRMSFPAAVICGGVFLTGLFVAFDAFRCFRGDE
jgi:hypothetical protein